MNIDISAEFLMITCIGTWNVYFFQYCYVILFIYLNIPWPPGEAKRISKLLYLCIINELDVSKYPSTSIKIDQFENKGNKRIF